MADSLMSPELDKSLASAVEALKNGAIDLSQQFPELAQQIIAREQVTAWICIAVGGIILLIAGILIILDLIKDWDGTGIGFGSCMAFISTIVIGVNINTLLVCSFAPKTIIVQEIAKLIH